MFEYTQIVFKQRFVLGENEREVGCNCAEEGKSMRLVQLEIFQRGFGNEATTQLSSGCLSYFFYCLLLQCSVRSLCACVRAREFASNGEIDKYSPTAKKTVTIIAYLCSALQFRYFLVFRFCSLCSACKCLQALNVIDYRHNKCMRLCA